MTSPTTNDDPRSTFPVPTPVEALPRRRRGEEPDEDDEREPAEAERAAHDDEAAPGRGDGIEEKLSFESRYVLIFGQITDSLAQAVCRRLLALSAKSAAPITMMISSPGGHVESGDAIHDMIRFVRAPVTTIGTGWVASAGVHIFLAPPKERRLCLPNTRFMIHQPAGGAGGQASDIAIQAREILRTRERIARTIAEQTGQPLEKVQREMERDHWMSASEAIDYGIVSRTIREQTEVAGS